MKYRTFSFRHSEVILEEKNFLNQYNELKTIINNISEQDIINRHNSFGENDESKLPKSLSKSINELLKEQFVAKNWKSEKQAGIFQDTNYQGETWRLDFAKDDLSVEVAFNHSSVIAWNLIKPVLASELNHVQKSVQTKIGVIITVTNEMKSLGGFDNAIGTFEKFLDYLKPLRNILTTPLLIVGIEPPTTFKIEQYQFAPRKKIGRVIKF